jgi:hypothetical protein
MMLANSPCGLRAEIRATSLRGATCPP